LIVAAIAKSSMSTKGGGKGTPSYKQVVVDREKGPRGIFFKTPAKRTSRSDPGKRQERIQNKNETTGEDTEETQNETQEIAKANGTEGRNPCKPKTTMIPKVILEDPQRKLYRDQMKMHALICKFMGLWLIERTLRN
jgi:hypothetical protein